MHRILELPLIFPDFGVGKFYAFPPPGGGGTDVHHGDTSVQFFLNHSVYQFTQKLMVNMSA
jgi:hypothetical protein